MTADGRTRRRYALLALIALVFLAGCVDYPPAWSVCLTCEDGLEAAARDGPNVSVTGSELHIDVHGNGTGRWTVRSELAGPGVESLRSDPALVDRFAREAVTDSVGGAAITYAIHDGEVDDLSARMEGDVLVTSFAVEDMARRGVGDVLLVDFFNTRGRRPALYGLGTDRLVVRGPSGTVVTNRPPRAAVSTDGGAAVWTRRHRTVSGETYIAFGRDREPTTRIATEATVAVAVAEWVVPSAVRLGFLHAVLLSGVAVLLARSTSVRPRSWIRDPRGAFRDLDRRVPPIEFVAVPLALFGLAVVAVVDPGGIGYGIVSPLAVFPPILPVALFALLGYSKDRDRRLARATTIGIGGSPMVMAAVVAVTLPASYVNPLNATIDVPVFATLLFGLPLFFLVRRR